MRSDPHAMQGTSLTFALVNREVQRLFWTIWTLFLSALYTGAVAAESALPASAGWIALVPLVCSLIWCRQWTAVGLHRAILDAETSGASPHDRLTFRWFAMTLASCGAASLCLFAAATAGYLFDGRTGSAVVAGVGGLLVGVLVWLHISDMEAGFRAVKSTPSDPSSGRGDDRLGADPPNGLRRTCHVVPTSGMMV